jgi:predicted nuclease with TOPRIM domain
MNELCKLKHKLDDQMKNPSNGDLSARVTTLESQLVKKDEKLKKLEKDNSKLEEENIQLNIRIMKELTEIQRKQ